MRVLLVCLLLIMVSLVILFLTCGNPSLLRAIGNHEYIYTVAIGGGNMSFKSGSLIDGFALPGYTKRGI